MPTLDERIGKLEADFNLLIQQRNKLADLMSEVKSTVREGEGVTALTFAILSIVSKLQDTEERLAEICERLGHIQDRMGEAVNLLAETDDEEEWIDPEAN